MGPPRKEELSGYLLDTTFLVRFLRGEEKAVSWMRRAAGEGHVLACSAVNVAEIYAGMKEKERPATEALLEALRCLQVSFDVARQAGEWRAKYRARGREVSLPDAIIGATAHIHGLALVTDNRKDFPMPGLAIFSP
ncbi:MAG: type II toxin-antitoxin system VapC family toxin [Candidatus Deferrimicrobiota bacterium]|jgi:predicted nucleic acid-binding protein